MTQNDAEGETLLAWVQEVRAVEHLQADPATLAEIRRFLQSHEAENVRASTHTVLENYPDWWTRNRRAPPGLLIEEQDDLEELYRHAGTLHALGVPLTLGERRTAAFRFFQDVEVWGSREASMPADQLIGPETALTRLVGSVVSEVFLQQGGFLDAAVYDASGLSQTKGVRKTSLRLVWPGVVVDAERASRVRDLLVHRVRSLASEGGALAELEASLLEHSQANGWHSVFADAAYSPKSLVRMPLSDRVSPLPLRAPERRPLSPIGVLRFTFAGEGKMKVEWLCRKAELQGAEWVKIGSLRQPADQKLTEWAVPAWPGNQPIPPSSTRTGRVKVRTAGGSDGGGGLRLRNKENNCSPPERAGQLLSVERRASGTPEEFAAKVEHHLGKATVEADGSLVWKQPNGDARIVLYGADRCVKVIGRPNQVRSLVVLVSPYTEAAAGLGRYGPNAAPPPSEAYAPVANGGDGGTATDEEQKDGVAPQSAAAPGGQLRVAQHAFEAEGQGELELAPGDAVCVTDDPTGGNDQDRWVYGRSEVSSQCGWFPLSHTVPQEEWQQQN
mmetsp:Transcript_89106/g.229967  ORF Transcript_89106/g.229967 Transcript_89106/m.229967 type:complete len:558 (+) Transcript_89106:52-1725(+)